VKLKLLDHGITHGHHPSSSAYLLMLPIAAMATNYGIKCNLFVLKMLIVDTVARALYWKASLAQNLLPQNHN
jgi:hypothetical protein